MQLQIECNPSSLKQSFCCICEESFEMKEARILVCNDQGISHGELCPHCISKGHRWISDRFDQISKPRNIVRTLRTSKRSVAIATKELVQS